MNKWQVQARMMEGCYRFITNGRYMERSVSVKLKSFTIMLLRAVNLYRPYGAIICLKHIYFIKPYIAIDQFYRTK